MRRISLVPILLALGLSTPLLAAHGDRARDLGIPLEGTPGKLNAITDVPGVLVGHTTLIEGEGALEVGKGPVRTGVTAILPRGRDGINQPVFAGWFSLNGDGEMTGTTFIEEKGSFWGPVMITNTHSVGIVRDSVHQWMHRNYGWPVSLPVVAETLDGPVPGWAGLNDANGMHLQPEHVFNALGNASGGVVQEGNVGGGTGMICNEFKGGIGTSSRLVSIESELFTVGVIVQCNYGKRSWLRVAGVPVGADLPSPSICYEGEVPAGSSVPNCSEPPRNVGADLGSIIVVVGTDVPLLPHQLKRVARRVSLGLGRLGSSAGDGSGDIFLAFSTVEKNAEEGAAFSEIRTLGNDWLTPVFEATVQATEEAVINAMLKAETMVGANDLRVPRLPHADLVEVLRKYNRIE